MGQSLEKILQKKFQLQQFRPGQKELITALLKGKNALGILPTGSGKSLCYQFSGYLLAGSTIIISPLISLMEDQVLQLQKQGEKAVIALNSSNSFAEKKWLLEHLEKFRFIFMSPEMFLQPQVLQKVQQLTLAQLVIDEIHCVSLWGNDFRPEYRQLAQVLQQLDNPLLLGLTATATPKVIADIQNLFFYDDSYVYQGSVERDNIALFVEKTEDKAATLKKFVHKTAAPGIIYCGTRKMVEEIYQEFKLYLRIGYYHGGLASNERRQLQQQFTEGQLDWLVATNAFGMGINKADIRSIIHYDLSDSLENYVQEIGRAGRDGQASQAILLYQTGDESLHYYFQKQRQEERRVFQFLIQQPNVDESNFSELQRKWYAESQMEESAAIIQRLTQHESDKFSQLNHMLDYIQASGCRRAKMLAYFDESLAEIPRNCCDFHQAKLLEKSTEVFTAEKTLPNWQEVLLKLFKE
ncbi:RecQ family ATP-dependent DNA helicase [Enterococcus sp. HY326]|uniref:RecQ family ATP-dependent DNA helicase n=1 Tax=Enterococcus sp. HY326 TaxID=2971265 RepID=UPI00223FC958|nr:RecQ family ATP-dependent DNA helicase [Enterococcus sp. HY326]